MVDVFISADSRDVAGLRNRIILEVARRREAGSRLFSSDDKLLEIAFSNLPTSAALGRWLVDEAARSRNADKDFLDDLESLPAAFTAGLLRAYAKRD